MSATDPEAILMSEVDGRVRDGRASNHVEAWRQVLNLPRRATAKAAEANQNARAIAMSEVRLSPEQAGLRRMNDARSIPGTTVQKTRPLRGEPIEFKVPDRKPNESFEEYRDRLLNRSIATSASSAAKPGSAGTDRETFAEAERGNAARRAAALANADRDREVTTHGAPVGYHDTTKQRDSALARMKARGESIDPKSLRFAERYAKTLKEST